MKKPEVATAKLTQGEGGADGAGGDDWNGGWSQLWESMGIHHDVANIARTVPKITPKPRVRDDEPKEQGQQSS